MSVSNEESLNQEKISFKIDEKDVLKTKLLSADKVLNPDIKPWKLDNLEQERVEKEKKILSSVVQSLTKEAAPEVKKQISLMKKTAYDEAYAEGFQQGLKSGKLEGERKALEEANEVLGHKVKSLQDLVEFMLQPYQSISEEVFLNLIEIIIEISRRLIKDEIKENTGWILKVLNEVVIKLPSDAKAIKVYLNPDDLVIVEQYASSNGKAWNLINDKSLIKGTCKIKQESSTLINDWQQNLNEMMNSLKSKSQEILSNNTSNKFSEDQLNNSKSEI